MYFLIIHSQKNIESAGAPHIETEIVRASSHEDAVKFLRQGWFFDSVDLSEVEKAVCEDVIGDYCSGSDFFEKKYLTKN